jgi:hypothetical protein
MGDPLAIIAMSLVIAGLDHTGQSDTLKAKSAAAVHASRLQGTAITVDGVLSEASWSAAVPVTDFTQRCPGSLRQ